MSAAQSVWAAGAWADGAWLAGAWQGDAVAQVCHDAASGDDHFNPVEYRAYVEKVFGKRDQAAEKNVSAPIAPETGSSYDFNRAQVASKRIAAIQGIEPHRAASSQGGSNISTITTPGKRIITPRGILEDDEAALAVFALLMFDD